MKSEQIALTFDAPTLQECGRLCSVRYDGRTIALDDRVLVEDDAPAIGQPQGAQDRAWFEKLQSGIILRKDLLLDDARATAAHLVFAGVERDDNETPLYVRINGVEVVRPPSKWAHPSARQYYTSDWGGAHFDNWFVVPIPVGALRAGRNEILLWADSPEVSWEVMVAADQEYARGSRTRLQHPDRSAKSRDGGTTWDWAHLGWQDALDGEYCVRLSLQRYVPSGTYISPVIDLAGEGEAKRYLKVCQTRMRWDVEQPVGCAVRARVRFSDSPRLDAPGWSDYVTAEGMELRAHGRRYVQFELELCTDNPLETPRLRGVSIESAVSEEVQHGPLCHRVHSVANVRVVRSSVEYIYEDFAALADLRSAFELDRVVAGAHGEFAAQLRLLRWAYRVPLGALDPYAWRYADLLNVQRDGAGHIVLNGDYGKRRRDGHCLFSNLALVAACTAMGYPARWVNISTKHTYGHEVAEVWSNEFGKWVFMDATRDYYIFDPDSGVPLGLVEIGQRLAEVMSGPSTWEFPVQGRVSNKAMLADVRVSYREGDLPYSVRSEDEVEGEDLLMYKGHIQMPLRNDFASRPHPVPWRLSSNWGSDQFYCYYSELFPRKEEYQGQTNRWQDFNPTLNGAELFLCETDRRGVLRVEIDTQTPHLEAYLVQVDDGVEQALDAGVFEWHLHEGTNQLRARVRNSAGVCGAPSTATVIAHHCY
jgi:hypothetical protein